MNTLSNHVVDRIVKDCVSLYLNLPKSGKPEDCEWTVLSCVVQHNRTTDKYQVVSLGTGTKCIGASKMSPIGNIINDSHAEVFARRGFLLYLYDQMQKSLQNKESIFEFKKENFHLKDDFAFIFYSSQLPCGDASIIPKTDDECFGDILISNKHKNVDDICDIQAKKSKVEEDIHRTGAKCLLNTKQDPKLEGKDYHMVGQVRTKPGRGERTLSVSCSDKIARWIHIGIQGSLLNMLLSEPIFIKSFIFGGGVPYSEETINRAFFNRNDEEILPDSKPLFYQSSIKFVHSKSEQRSRPAFGSIVCVNTTPRFLDVAIQGKKLGVTKKKLISKSSYLSICKYNLYKMFLDVVKANQDIKLAIGIEDVTQAKYNEMKLKSKQYQDRWRHTRDNFFKTWTTKPDIYTFCIDDT